MKEVEWMDRVKGGFKLTLTGLLILFLFWGSASHCREAFALAGDTEKAFGLDGSIRTLFFLLDQDGTLPFSGQNNFDVLSQTITRLTAAGKPTQSLSYEIHLVQDLTFSTEKISGGSLLGSDNTNTDHVFRYRVLDASWNVLEQDRSLSTITFDRFNAKTSFGWGDVTVGRQAITFGKTYFWNPLDVFYPLGASQFDRDYKPGVDAVKVDIPLGLYSGFTMVGAAGPRVKIGAGTGVGNDPQDASWYGAALLGRLFADVAGWDFSLQGGKVFGGWQVGAGVVGDVGPVQVRSELVQFVALSSDPLPSPLQGNLMEDSFQGVVGLGHRFENSLSLDFEYFYNGAGDPDNLNAALVRMGFGSSLQMSRHLAGLVARYEFSPLVIGELGAIVSLSDGSLQLQPLVIISLSNEMDLLIGATLNFGKQPEMGSGATADIQSEFGTAPTFFFAEWKYYF
jgi:hypothetical protein